MPRAELAAHLSEKMGLSFLVPDLCICVYLITIAKHVVFLRAFFANRLEPLMLANIQNRGRVAGVRAVSTGSRPRARRGASPNPPSPSLRRTGRRSASIRLALDKRRLAVKNVLVHLVAASPRWIICGSRIVLRRGRNRRSRRSPFSCISCFSWCLLQDPTWREPLIPPDPENDRVHPERT